MSVITYLIEIMLAKIRLLNDEISINKQVLNKCNPNIAVKAGRLVIWKT